MLPVLSSKELRKINECIKENLSEMEVSLDLGLTKTKIKLNKKGFYVGNKLIEIPKIREDDNSCYVVINNKLKKIQFFSPETRSLYKLIPTKYRPILQISGTSMHKKEFVERIKRDKLGGKVLDAGTGLGYTAIAASRTANYVITVERDGTVIEIAKLNPYSQDLFIRKNIRMIKGDILEVIKKFKDCEFDFIIFDAGTPKASGEFFSLNNYKEACRVLKKNGKLYHYLPRHHIERGRDFGAEVIKRMKIAGFSIVERNVKDSYAIFQR